MCYTYSLSNKDKAELENTVYLCYLCKCFGLLGNSLLSHLNKLYFNYLNDSKGLSLDTDTKDLFYKASLLLPNNN